MSHSIRSSNNDASEMTIRRDLDLRLTTLVPLYHAEKPYADSYCYDI